MVPLKELVDYILHFDSYLQVVIRAYGAWTYLFLFCIIFLETGLVVTPFLPGDSLLFAAGAFAAKGDLDIKLLIAVVAAATIIGDTANYWLGHYLGLGVFKKYIRKEHLRKTHEFYEKYGAKTIVIARFVPFVRTIAPFVAGLGAMAYKRFLIYNVVGGLAWVSLFVLGGYYFGSISLVKENFILVMAAIIAVSFIPAVIEYYRYKKKK